MEIIVLFYLMLVHFPPFQRNYNLKFFSPKFSLDYLQSSFSKIPRVMFCQILLQFLINFSQNSFIISFNFFLVAESNLCKLSLSFALKCFIYFFIFQMNAPEIFVCTRLFRAFSEHYLFKIPFEL